jgi:hypothetical protein
MIEINNINRADWRPFSPAAAHAALSFAQPAAAEAELTPFSKALLEATGGSSLRDARINAIRGEIKAGTFETPERLTGTVSRLLDLLG